MIRCPSYYCPHIITWLNFCSLDLCLVEIMMMVAVLRMKKLGYDLGSFDCVYVATVGCIFCSLMWYFTSVISRWPLQLTTLYDGVGSLWFYIFLLVRSDFFEFLSVRENQRSLKMQLREEIYSMKSLLPMNSWLHQILANQSQHLFLTMWWVYFLVYLGCDAVLIHFS